jgi:transposase-like protein
MRSLGEGLLRALLGHGVTMTFNLTDPIFTDQDKAREHFEAIHWPNGPVCPHCGATSEHVTLMASKKTRRGLYQCNACREPFAVKMGTVMESSHISHRKWTLGFHLMAASKRGCLRTSCTGCSA